jgi:hypothetical protein
MCKVKDEYEPKRYFLLVFFRYLVGIVIASLCWRCNEWVGLSMAFEKILKV